MKIIAYLTGICLFISTAAFSQAPSGAQSETIKVWGNCGMCKGHIEKAAKEAGASSAIWDKTTKLLAVKYEASKTSNRKIQEKIAAAGYDTEDLTGNGKAYEGLDECCKYERKAVTKDKDKKTAMNCCEKTAEKASCCTDAKASCCAG